MALRELFAVFGIDFETKALNQGNAAISGAFSQLQKFGGLIASSWLTHGIYELATGVADFADELTDAGAAIGMNAQELLAWRTVGESVGVGAEQLRSVFGAFARNVDAANTGNRDTAKSFADLGVELKDINRAARPTSELLGETLTAIARMPDPTARAAQAMRLLGEQGARLLPAFEAGAGGLTEMQLAVQELFGGDLEAAAEQADELEKQTALWNLGLQAVKTTIALELLPHITDFVSAGAKLVRWFQEITRGTNVLEAAFVVLGAAAAIAAFKMILPFLPALATFALVALALGVVILVVDDLIAMFTGGNSVIAEFIDTVWGVGTAAEAVNDLKMAWEGLGLALSDAWTWIKGIAESVGTSIGNFVTWADKINLLTGTYRTLKTILTSVWNVLKQINELTKSPWQRAVERDAASADLGGEQRQERRGFGAGTLNQDSRAARMARFRANADAVASGGTARLPSTGSRAPVNIRQQNPTTIIVQGSADPEATANEVMSRVEARQNQSLQDTRNALISTAD